MTTKPKDEKMASTSKAQAEHDTRVRLKRLKPGQPLKHGGPVAEKIRDLVLDPTKTYEQVATEVKKEVPEAKTTARSVASVVRGLRRDGYRVPERRHD